MASRRGARLLAEMLDGYGVDHVFFVPTILSHTLLEMEQRTGISRVVTHGEKAAAYMADGYGRVSGRPGVCFGQTVGAANLAAGLRDAYMGCSPMIAFTGGPYTKGPASGRDRNRYQEVNDFPIFGAVTKASTRAENIGDLARSVRQAFRTATTDRPGPVHIELPGHLGEELELVETDEPLLVESQFAAAPPFRSLPDDASIASAADLLATADRPVLILGGGARLSGAGLAAATLAERHGIPVVTSLNAKATIPADHPMNFGVVGAYPRHSTNQLVEEADLALFVGSKTGSQVTRKWTLPRPGTTVIQCDVVAADMGINYPNTVSLLGDARDTLELLTAALATGSSVDRTPWVRRAQELRADWYTEWTPLLTSEDYPIRPERLCGEISDHLPSDGILVSDTGHSGMWTGGYVDLRHGGQDYIRAAGSLGWAFPAALGAKCAEPDRPVVAFTGDGGFLYHLAEVETAARWGINAVIVVNNNNSLNQEIGIYTDVYGGTLHGKHHELWRFEDVNLSEVSRGLGAAAFRVEKPGQIGSAIEAALEAGRPAVVEVVTDELVRAPVA